MPRERVSDPRLQELTKFEKVLFLQATRNNFYSFFKFIFSDSIRAIEGTFIDGEHFRRWCYELQQNEKTSKKSARFHGKSILLYAWIMWLMWKQENPYDDGIYFSFTLDLAQDHLKKCNRYIDVNPYFEREFIKLSNADSIVHYRRRGGKEFYFEPAAFAVQMAPGDLIVLGPDKYTSEQQTLGGLFFNRPEGTLFFNPARRTPPEIKPAVRVYILACSAIND